VNADLFGVSIEEQIACVEREISMRVHVYARRVLAKQMTQKTADKELAHMRAVLATLKSIKE
jgi:hypothetical protein